MADVSAVAVKQFGGLKTMNSNAVVGDFSLRHIEFDRNRLRYMSGQEQLNALSITNLAYEVAWLPPPIHTERVSEGGDWVPLRSEIQIVIGSNTNCPHSSFVDLMRVWKYRTKLHIPYTEIPAGSTSSSEYRLLPEDLEWAKQLGRKLPVTAFFTNELFFGGTVGAALCPKQSNRPDQTGLGRSIVVKGSVPSNDTTPPR